MNNEAYQIKNAVKQITGHELDTILVLGANKETGLTLQIVEGEVALLATLIADLYKKQPKLKQMVQDAEQLNNGKVPDDLVKALFEMLGGNDNE